MAAQRECVYSRRAIVGGAAMNTLPTDVVPVDSPSLLPPVMYNWRTEQGGSLGPCAGSADFWVLVPRLLRFWIYETSDLKSQAVRNAAMADTQMVISDSRTELAVAAALSTGTTTMEFCATGFKQLK